MGILCAHSSELDESNILLKMKDDSEFGIYKNTFNKANKDIWVFAKNNIVVTIITIGGGMTLGFVTLIEIIFNAFISGVLVGIQVVRELPKIYACYCDGIEQKQFFGKFVDKFCANIL